jgi:hypothetical protein
MDFQLHAVFAGLLTGAKKVYPQNFNEHAARTVGLTGTTWQAQG